MIKRGNWGHPYFVVRGEILGFAKALAKSVFINQERKLEDRRRSDTILVLTINDVD